MGVGVQLCLFYLQSARVPHPSCPNPNPNQNFNLKFKIICLSNPQLQIPQTILAVELWVGLRRQTSITVLLNSIYIFPSPTPFLLSSNTYYRHPLSPISCSSSTARLVTPLNHFVLLLFCIFNFVNLILKNIVDSIIILEHTCFSRPTSLIYSNMQSSIIYPMTKHKMKNKPVPFLQTHHNCNPFCSHHFLELHNIPFANPSSKHPHYLLINYEEPHQRAII